MIDIPKHKSTQRFLISDSKTKEVYGTNSLKGFTEAAASKRAALYNTATGGKPRFKVLEVNSCDDIK